MSIEKKVEASLPVQSRVDTRTLATLKSFWDSEGVYIETVSRLISDSLDLLLHILQTNEKIQMPFTTFTEAQDFLIQRGLYQPGLGKRGRQKASTAKKFEYLRMEGIEPKTFLPKDYNILHNKRSVQTSDVEPVHNVGSITKRDRIEELGKEAVRIFNSPTLGLTKEEFRKQQIERAGIKYENGVCVLKGDGTEGCVTNKDLPAEDIEQRNVKAREENPRVQTKREKPEDLRPRKLTEEELDIKDQKREKKERDYLRALNLNEVPSEAIENCVVLLKDKEE